jgi:hypothetical protein
MAHLGDALPLLGYPRNRKSHQEMGIAACPMAAELELDTLFMVVLVSRGWLPLPDI